MTTLASLCLRIIAFAQGLNPFLFRRRKRIGAGARGQSGWNRVRCQPAEGMRRGRVAIASFLVPLLEGGIAAGAALTAFIGCAVLGAVAAPARCRLRAADPVVGLGIATGILTVLGATFRVPLSA